MRTTNLLSCLSIAAIAACSDNGEPANTDTGGRLGRSVGGNGVDTGSATTHNQGGYASFGGNAVGGTNVGGGANAFGGVTTAGNVLNQGGVTDPGGVTSRGGVTGRGGAATGGVRTAGGASAIGGKSVGGNPSGGASLGGAATGGAANGGVATGGKALGGGTIGGATAGGAATGGAAGLPPCATNQMSMCTGTNPIVCNFGGSEGDYEVTVDLGGTAAGDTYVEAESNRRMLAPVKTAAGQTLRFSFGVNVRVPEGQPVQAVSAGTPGLQIYLRGATPKLTAICAKPLTSKPKVWIAGDSTVCDQDGTDYAGWGQHLPQFFGLPVSVANYADSGESSGSVLNSARMWGAIRAGWKSGDWVLVQVGHNDKDVSAAAFRSNITAYVTEAKAAGVNIVLCTPISRVGYALAAEHVNSTGANLPQIIRDVGKAQSVPVIDLTVTTWNWLQTIDWKQYFALGTDRTHTNPAGAEVIAGFVRNAVRDQKLSLATYAR